MKFTIAVSLVASATAFAPASHRQTSSALNEFCNGYVGGEGPEPVLLGKNGFQNWDPAGFCDSCPEWIPWFREAELKHGRIAMIACFGAVVPEYMRIPGEQFSFEAIPKVIDAHDALPDSMLQIFAAISYVEATSWAALSNMNEFDREPGDFGFDPLKLKPKDEAAFKRMQLRELKNGRLAMLGISGIVAGSLVTGEHFPFITFS